MTCREFQDLISAAVDRYLSGEEMTGFLSHARICPGCRTDYELEMTTKLVVHNRVRRVATPGSVSASLASLLQAEAARDSLSRPVRWAALVSGPLFKPALGVGLAAATVAVILFAIPDRSPGPADGQSDVIAQSFSNYRAVLAGAITPQLFTEKPDQVQAFFAGKTGFPVRVPKMRSCTLVGAVLNQFSGTPLAHVVYRRNGDIVYMYQACWETIQSGGPLSLPERVRVSLARTGWYTESQLDGSSIAVWTSGETLCAAVARMSTDDLLSCLESQPDPSP